MPDGKPMKGKFDLVLVSPKNRAKAIKLLGQDTELAPKQDPESAENAASSVHGLKWMVVRTWLRQRRDRPERQPMGFCR